MRAIAPAPDSSTFASLGANRPAPSVSEISGKPASRATIGRFLRVSASPREKSSSAAASIRDRNSALPPDKRRLSLRGVSNKFPRNNVKRVNFAQRKNWI